MGWLHALFLGASLGMAQEDPVATAASIHNAKMPSDITLERDVVYCVRDRISLKLDIYRSKNTPAKLPFPVLFIHGGAWRVGRKDQPNPTLWAITQAGFVSIAISYRMSQEAIFPAQIADCKEAIRWIRAHAVELNTDAEKIGVWGMSAGGHLAALLGTSGGVNELNGTEIQVAGSSRVQAVVDLYGATDLIKLMQQRRATPYGRADLMGDRAPENQLIGGDVLQNQLLAQTASPMAYVTPDDPPFLIIQGDKDEVVPKEQSQMLFDALKAEGVPAQLKIIKGMKHELPGPAITEMIVDFFKAELR